MKRTNAWSLMLAGLALGALVGLEKRRGLEARPSSLREPPQNLRLVLTENSAPAQPPLLPTPPQTARTPRARIRVLYLRHYRRLSIVVTAVIPLQLQAGQSL